MRVLQLPRAVAIRLLRQTNTLNRYFELRRRIRGIRSALVSWIGPPSRVVAAHERVGGVIRQDSGVWWVAKLTTFMNVSTARDENLAAVASMLDAAGIPYFFVPIRDRRQYRLGVDERHREVLAESLESVIRSPLTYVRPAGLRSRRLLPMFDHGRFEDVDDALKSANLWLVWTCYADRSGYGFIGLESACQIEFWRPSMMGPLLDADADETEDEGDDSSPTAASSVDGVQDSDAELVPTQEEWAEAIDRPTADEFASSSLVISSPVRTTRLRARRPNMLTPRVPIELCAESAVEVGGVRVPAPHDFARFHLSRQFRFPIDAVYTWVDDADPAWIERRRLASEAYETDISVDASIDARYRNRNELMYSLRSIAMNAPFIRHVYVVTDRQCPTWLNADADGITVVDHSEIFYQSDRLPTFNSHAIESRLHRIDGLSEHYLYVNDDVFFGRPVEPSHFFTSSGLSKFFPSRARVPLGPPVWDEPSVTSAAKNGRNMLSDELAAFPLRKMKHTPHPQRKSTIEDMERRYPADMRRVGSNQFRSHTDVPVASWLHHYHGEAIGQAVEGKLRYNYLSLAADNLPDRLEALVQRRYDTWCLNDVSVGDTLSVDATLASFLRRTFPWPSPWERETT